MCKESQTKAKANKSSKSRGVFRPCQTSKMELFEKISDGLQPSIILTKSSLSDVRQGSKYAPLFFRYFKLPAQRIFLSYNAFYSEKKYQEMQRISNLLKKSKFEGSRFLLISIRTATKIYTKQHNS